MKTLLTTILILSLSVCAYATDFSTINKDSLASFLEIMPKYRAIVQKYGGDTETDDIMSMAKGSQLYKKIEALLSKYDISIEEFTTLLQKITLAFASAQMENSGMPVMPFGINKMSATSDDEMDIIKKNLEAIEKAFGED